MNNLKSKISNSQFLRVLIVKDSEDDALLIIRELKKGGYNPVYERVETASAMKKVLKEKELDIILCDYKIPKFTAPSAIALLKKVNIDIPLIIVSGNIGEDVGIDCMRLGAQDYIMKGKLFRLCLTVTKELKKAKVRNKQKQAEFQKRLRSKRGIKARKNIELFLKICRKVILKLILPATSLFSMIQCVKSLAIPKRN
jgi:DNA-binding NtrC family response regulator